MKMITLFKQMLFTPNLLADDCIFDSYVIFNRIVE